MKKRKYLIIVLIIALINLAGCNKKDISIISKKDFLMDTIFKVDIYDSEDEDLLEDIFDRFFEIQNRMSGTMEASDLIKLNEAAGKNKVKINSDTYKVLEEAKKVAEISEGLFDPTIGPLSRLWNISGDLESREWIPTKIDIKRYRNHVDYRKLELLSDNYAYLTEEGMELDLGAIAKGYAADQAKEILDKNKINSAMIDLGGNIYAYGKKYNGELWNIGIQDPFVDNAKYIGIISVENKSVVTSGDYQRFFEKDGRKYHHIINPYTGYPSNNDLASVSIVSDSSMEADAFSTYLFLAGLEESIEILKKYPDLDAVLITKSKEIYLTENLKQNFKLNENAKEFKIINE